MEKSERAAAGEDAIEQPGQEPPLDRRQGHCKSSIAEELSSKVLWLLACRVSDVSAVFKESP